MAIRLDFKFLECEEFVLETTSFWPRANSTRCALLSMTSDLALTMWVFSRSNNGYRSLHFLPLKISSVLCIEVPQDHKWPSSVVCNIYFLQVLATPLLSWDRRLCRRRLVTFFVIVSAHLVFISPSLSEIGSISSKVSTRLLFTTKASPPRPLLFYSAGKFFRGLPIKYQM